MTAIRGRFVVFEGLDGAGTTTQSRMLWESARDRGLIAALTREPTDGPVGRLIRRALTGGLGNRGEETTISETAICMLFAADRIEHSREIERLRDTGSLVVCDRYILSSIAYQSLDPGITPERVVEVNRGVAVPDVTLLLKVPVEECLRRLEHRADSPTIYETEEVLARIDRNYEKTRALYERHFGPLIDIDATPIAQDVHEAVMQSLAAYLPH